MTTSKSTSTLSEKTIKNKEVVAAAETPEKERKAKVSDSDFLDVIWGAETSACPTLKTKEMMKAFQVRSTEEERPAAENSPACPEGGGADEEGGAKTTIAGGGGGMMCAKMGPQQGRRQI
jgi:hypothetical protein